MNGKFIEDLNINIAPAISEQAAVQNAIQSIKGSNHKNNSPSLQIASVNGTFHKESLKLCYLVNVCTEVPYQVYDVFIDAITGQVANKITKIAHGDQVGTANTLYSGTKTITADNFSGSFRLRETGRPIQTYDMQNGTNFSNAVDFTDNDNSWVEQSYVLESITVSNISSSWWYNAIADQTPDLYLIVYDGLNNPVLQTDYASNLNPPLIFTTKLQLTNPPYSFEIWDYDAVGSDDFGGSYSININIGSNNFSGNGNNGTYQIAGQNNPALDVHWGMEQTYDYYLNEHSRNSFDGAGSTIKSYVHYDFKYNNAFWDGQRMVFGDGDGVSMDFLVGLDVAGHEFTHAVVNYSANLVYQGESGALNESFADIFGTAIEFYSGVSPDWTIGEDIMLSSSYMRSMSNPNSENQPDTYDGTMWADPTDLNYDHGGVHINSGVQNFWFYLLSQGGSGTNDNGDSYSVTGIGINKAKQIAYRNLTTKLTSSSNYLDAMNGAIESAEDLYGNGSPEYWAVIDAWYAVGLGSANSGSYCSGLTTFTETSGSFTDGSGSADYQINSDCMWLIQPTGANNITLSFSAFDTETDYDTVIVYDGPDTTYTKLMTWWGNTLPPNINSSSGAMLVRFISDNTITASGWSASYTSTGTAYCDGGNILTSASGSFTDGSGGSNYGNNSECFWYIAPPGATSVTLSFSSFSTELNYDGIVVYDDLNGTNQLGVYSGSSLPSPVVSNTGEMLVIFVSDFSTTDAGFSASYTSTGTPYCSGTSNLTTDYAVFDDGSSTNNYYNNSNCDWLIQPPGATSITLSFTSFDLEEPSSDGNTIYDYVDVYDGPNTSATLLGTYSGSNIPPAITSSGGSLYVRFVSDFSVNTGGWEAYYLTTTNTFCNSSTNLTAGSGSFNDGSGGNDYGNNSDCQWLIQPTNATSITLSFSSFNTEQDYDGIIVYDGADTTAPQLGVFTGSTVPSPIVSTGGSMLVWFLSDEAIRASGWNASYTAQISTGIEDSDNKHGTLEVYPNPYHHQTTIRYVLNERADISLEIYTLIGEKVKTIVFEPQEKGEYSYLFSAKELGFSSGVYMLKFGINGNQLSHRLIELK